MVYALSYIAEMRDDALIMVYQNSSYHKTAIF